MLTDIWFTPGYTCANFWFCPELGWGGLQGTPPRKTIIPVRWPNG